MRVRWLLFWLLLLGFLSHQSTYVSFLKTVLKLQNVHDRSTDVQRRAWRSNSRSQEGLRSTCMHTKKRVSSFPGIKIGLEDLFTSWRYMEAKVRAEVHKVTTKVNSHYQIHGQRKTTEMQMMPRPLDSLNIQFLMCWLFQITPYARKALDNWVSLFVFLAFGHSLPGQDVDVFFSPQVCAQALQREMAERKAAYKQHGPIPLGNCVVQKHLHPHPVVP
ncbi:NPIP-like protein ENSP00000346774, partial [Macaca fascicularis]